jgi:hypothetical protein
MTAVEIPADGDPAGPRPRLVAVDTDGTSREWEGPDPEDTLAENEALRAQVRALEEQVEDQEKVIASHESALRGWAIRYANLKADKEEAARRDSLWPEAVRLFKLWREETGHKRAKWGLDRFEQIRPHLKKYGPMICEMAIVGHAFEHHTDRRKNGTTRHYDSWELCFRTSDHVEERANRCPKDRMKEIRARFTIEDEDPAAGADGEAMAPAQPTLEGTGTDG